jgi:hypothetical protein
MILTGKRRRLNRDNRMAPRLAAPDYTAEVNATVPLTYIHAFAERGLWQTL